MLYQSSIPSLVTAMLVIGAISVAIAAKDLLVKQETRAVSAAGKVNGSRPGDRSCVSIWQVGTAYRDVHTGSGQCSAWMASRLCGNMHAGTARYNEILSKQVLAVIWGLHWTDLWC